MIWKENLKNGQNVLEKWHNVVMRYYSHLFQMPPKKVKHGGARVDAGRKSLTGEYGNDKTMEEKKKADRNRKAKDRGQLKVPEARSVVESLQYGCGNAERRCLSFFHEQIINLCKSAI